MVYVKRYPINFNNLYPIFIGGSSVERDDSAKTLEFSSDEENDDEYEIDEEEEIRLRIKELLLTEYNKNKLKIMFKSTIYKENYILYTHKIVDIMNKHIFFHATLHENCENILKNGLIPFHAEGLTSIISVDNAVQLQDPEVRQHVYMTSTFALAQFYGNYISTKRKKKYIIFGIILDDALLDHTLLKPDLETTSFNGKIEAFKFKGSIESTNFFNPLIEPFHLDSLVLKFILNKLGVNIEQKIDKYTLGYILQFHIMDIYYSKYLKSMQYTEDFDQQTVCKMNK